MIGTSQSAQVLYSTRTFRSLLDALARPGKINQLENPHFLGNALSYFSQMTASDTLINMYALGALLTLLDRETTFIMAADGQWLPRTDSAVQWTMLRSGSNTVNAEQAAFAFFCDGGNGKLLAQLSVGTLLEPELSATALYCVEQLTSGEDADAAKKREDGITLELRGPGIQELRTANVVGLSESDIKAILFARQNYPLGIDVYLVDGTGRCLGLPRTTRIRVLSKEK
ncbi:phosphonate C-P lyase system protein PhnH [Dictyobacter formicarum]|uniref:Phosphonate C-P lyase system protein PhnH n=1 Tax=Dictyobacter formicarum TaxID=2778368 RepID=A0ABQ3VDB6_9CHLR|nr:phosphonate C-P lyase system protein PhnH [Dictyobacter formicarum]GHO83902.1 phosphonate C-P lyase system protein PhnH [Dictyobacter formicarum]